MKVMKVINITEVTIKLQFKLPQALISRGFILLTGIILLNITRSLKFNMMPSSRLFASFSFPPISLNAAGGGIK